MFAVQGPRSRDIINALAAEPADSQRFFSIRGRQIARAFSALSAKRMFWGRQDEADAKIARESGATSVKSESGA